MRGAARKGGPYRDHMILLLRPPLAHGQLTLGSNELGAQGRAAPKEHADETEEVTGQFAEASQHVPEVPEEVDDGIHAASIPRKASDGNFA